MKVCLKISITGVINSQSACSGVYNSQCEVCCHVVNSVVHNMGSAWSIEGKKGRLL